MIIKCNSCELPLGESSQEISMTCFGCIGEISQFKSIFLDIEDEKEYIMELVKMSGRLARYHETYEKIRNLWANCLETVKND